MSFFNFFRSQLFVTPPQPTHSFAGQTVIVTGSNVGLGREAARHIARLGASRLILAVRNLEAGEAAKADIIATTSSTTTIEVWKVDLSNNASVQAFAQRVTVDLDRLDVLLENAGISTEAFSRVEDGGHEKTIQVNVIGTFLLAFLLLPKLQHTAQHFGVQPRAVIVASEVHAWTKFPEKREADIFAALSDEKKAAKTMGERYMTSKLLEILVIRQIAPRFKDAGVILNCLNPGLCHSELVREGNVGVSVLKALLARTTEVGGRTLVAGAAAGEESHGAYMTDSRVDNDRLSKFVRSDDGDAVGRHVWTELKAILEGIQPGVTQGA